MRRVNLLPPEEPPVEPPAEPVEPVEDPELALPLVLVPEELGPDGPPPEDEGEEGCEECEPLLPPDEEVSLPPLLSAGAGSTAVPGAPTSARAAASPAFG